MASGPAPFASSKETTNYARLCRLLVDVGTQALRDTFDRIHAPATLHRILSNTSAAYPTLQWLKKKRILNPSQWGKLYPTVPLFVSSASFDITLLMVLLRNICGFSPPASTGSWDVLPLHGDNSTEANIARIKCYRDNIYAHSSQASVDDTTFNVLWQEISNALLALGSGTMYATAIGRLKTECMDPDFEEHYRELLKEWKKDDDNTKERFGKVEEMRTQLTRDQGAIKERLREIEEIRTQLTRDQGAIKETLRESEDIFKRLETDKGSVKDTLKEMQEILRQRMFSQDITKDKLSKMEEMLRQLMFSEDILKDKLSKMEVTPPEIHIRGPKALEAYNKALTEGKTRVKRIPIMLIGQHRSGKTSLKKSLRGIAFNPDESSTVGIDADPSYFKVATETWKIGETDQAANKEVTTSYEHNLALLVVENLKEQELISEERTVDKSADSEKLPVDFTTSAQTETAKDQKSFESHSQGSNNPLPSSHIPEEIKTLIKKLREEADTIEDEDDIYSVLWDFAGESVYYETHPLFLTSRAIYLLVYDLSRDPYERAQPVKKQGVFKKTEDKFSRRTNHDYLDYWMTSVASLSSPDKDHAVYSASTSIVPPKSLPPVFLVCTHADKPYGGNGPYNLALEVFGTLESKPYMTHLHDFFVVDNTKAGLESECPEVVRLREEIAAVAKELPQMKEIIPVKWLRYEKALHKTLDDGRRWIYFEDAKRIASEVCQIHDKQEFVTLLDFLHDQRILIHFDDTPALNKLVILDPQWLIDVFKKVITVTRYNHREKEFKELWLKLEREGVMEEKLLQHVWGSFLEHDTFETFIAIMEKFSLLCSRPLSDASCDKQYLVQSMLKSHPPKAVTELIASAELPSLFLKFESGQVPLRLFPRLVLQFFQRGENEFWSSLRLYKNFARFYTAGDENCSVVLLCSTSFIEVVVHRGNAMPGDFQSNLIVSSGAQHDSFEVFCADAVYRQLVVVLECMRNQFCWLKRMRYQAGVICPVCCRGKLVTAYCHTHDKVGCEQEECLHFLSESDLQSANQFITCNKSAAARNNKVWVKDFAAWFSFPNKETAADVVDGSVLSSCTGNEHNSPPLLPCNVVESLRSRSCDPNEIVLQLKKGLHLDQTRLEQPNPETQRMIRCLAKIAKNSNNIEVFKHLREITPAGTTGPLLPGNLDIRNIPVRQMRELTIDLSGGGEWKDVAERLGLSPKEIRFLDERTLNPCDAALAAVSQLHYISVDKLCDTLTGCGLPLLADTL